MEMLNGDISVDIIVKQMDVALCFKMLYYYYNLYVWTVLLIVTLHKVPLVVSRSNNHLSMQSAYFTPFYHQPMDLTILFITNLLLVLKIRLYVNLGMQYILGDSNNNNKICKTCFKVYYQFPPAACCCIFLVYRY